jgi:FkbM family methyltransferase
MNIPLEHEWDKKSVDFPLTKDSTVFEIGGYEGRWAREIAKLYNPSLYVFEPQRWAYKKCEAALDGYNAHLYNFGLATESGEFPLGNWETDGCSLVNLPGDKPIGVGWFVTWKNFLDGIAPPVRHIDLCLMNIEGYEFELIPHMIETGVMEKIDYFMCQFHLFDKNEQAYYDIRAELGKTKKIRFDYGPILTCWENK